MKKNITPLLFGIIFILGGLAYIGSIFFDWRFDLFFDGWWTLFIIVPAFVSMLANRPRPFNICALFIGVILLLSAQDIVPSNHIWTIIVSAVIIFAGLSLISTFFRNPKPTNMSYTYNINTPNGSTTYEAGDTVYEANATASEPNNTTYEPNQTNYNNSYAGNTYKNQDSNSRPDYNAILSSVETKNTSNDFQGASISAILGGVELDLRDVIILRDIGIDCTAIMGGIDIWAPRNVRIALNKTDILGGTSCNALTMPADANVPLVTFTCTTVMGGIEIK